MNAQRSPDDLLTARQIAEQYGLEPQVAQSLLRNLGRRGMLVTFPGFKRAFVRRRDVEPVEHRLQSSGGTT